MTARCVSCDDLTSEVAALTVERDRLAREVERLRTQIDQWRLALKTERDQGAARGREVVCVASLPDDDTGDRTCIVHGRPIRALESCGGES